MSVNDKNIAFSSISRRLIVYIVLCSSILTLLLTIFQLYRDYQAELSLVDLAFDQIEKVHVATISESVWGSDTEKLKTIVRGLSNSRDLRYVEIIENGEVLVSFGDKPETGVNFRTFPLTFNSRDRSLQIGKLNVAFDIDAINQRLLDRVFVILISNALKTTLVVAFMIMLFYRMVARHLTHISQYLIDQKAGEIGRPFKLERRQTSPAQEDEFDQVVKSLNRHLQELNSQITERKKSESFLQASEERFRDFAESSSDWFWEMDVNSNYTYLSAQFFELTGFSPEDIYGHDQRSNIAPDSENLDSEKWQRHLLRIEKRIAFKNFEYQLLKQDGKAITISVNGRPVFNSEGQFDGFRGTCTDITEQKHTSERLRYQASHDALTGLISRYEFEQRASRLLSTIRDEPAEHAMCFLDLDQFKVINDTCGHSAGDELLRQLGKMLEKTARKRDTLARLGGDEFGILMEHCPLGQAHRVADEVLKAIMDYQFYWEGKVFRIGVSIGLVAITKATASFTELFKQADAACYLAKDLGRNRIHVYHPEDTELAVRHGEMQWVGRINHALEENSFCLYAQPIVSLEGDDLKHFEILVRMLDDQGQIIPPGAFLPAAERYNLIGRLDAWVVKQACIFLSEQPAFVEQIDFISINLSGPSLTNQDFLETIMRNFREYDLSPSKICFEITETVAISNLEMATRFISTLKQEGCRFALDDFGTGVSSFEYLKNLPVNYLKIDGMFVRDIVDDPIDLAMVKSINEIGQVMGMQTIAEFVENKEIEGMLRTIGVNYAQGYSLGKPVPLEALINQLDNNDYLSL